MKNSDIANPAAIETMNKLSAQKLKGKLAFKLAINLKAIQPLVEAFNAERQKLVEKYSKKDSEGKLIFTDEEKKNVLIDNAPEFTKEMDALIELDITEVCKIIKITQDELDQIELTTAEMVPITWMVAD